VEEKLESLYNSGRLARGDLDSVWRGGKVVTFAIDRCVMALASAACGNRQCSAGMR
jgi:hypothetical protein